MAALVVTYPTRPGARFDRDYYVGQHLPLLERAWAPSGLIAASAFFPGGDDPRHLAVAVLEFSDDAAIDAALASAGTPRVLDDVANFTDLAPAIARGTPL